MANITIPYNYIPRDYQYPRFNQFALQNLVDYNTLFERPKQPFGVDVWHRRAGKDKSYINLLAKEAFRRIGTYFYILPYYKQARVVVWEGVDRLGWRLINHFPAPLIKRSNDQMMSLELVNGSFIRFLGSDNIDALVGSNPRGVLFSEFSLHKPQAWEYIEPILMENKGWALFNGTPRGRNHFYRMFKMAKSNPEWSQQMLTIKDTFQKDPITGQMIPVVSEADIEKLRERGTPEEIIQQEYYCSFDAAIVGAYYASIINDKSWIGLVPWEPTLPVHTAWDLGFRDHTAIIYFQEAFNEIRILGGYSNRGKELQHYWNVLEEKPYSWGTHYLPHDVEVHELGSGQSRKTTLQQLGMKNIRTVARVRKKIEGVNAVRNILPRCYFDEEGCEDLLEALRSYHADYDPDAKILSLQPVHDWSAHYADAIQTLALGTKRYRAGTSTDLANQTTAIGYNHDPYSVEQYTDPNNYDPYDPQYERRAA